MDTKTVALSLSLLLGAALAPGTMAQGASQAITEQEAQAIAVDAYIYFYPLITMDVTRRQFTNIAPGKELGKGPMNMFNTSWSIRPPTSRGSYAPTSTPYIPLPIWT